MDEVKEQGIEKVLKAAIAHVTRGTIGYGISIDLDSIDPRDAPGVAVPEPNGIPAEALIQALKTVADDPRLLGMEISEFNPARDKDHLTEKVIVALLGAITQGLALRMESYDTIA